MVRTPSPVLSRMRYLTGNPHRAGLTGHPPGGQVHDSDVATGGPPYGVLLNEVRFAIPNELFQHNNIRRRRNCVQHLGARPWDGGTRDHAPTRFRCGLRRLPPGSPPAPGAGIHNRAQLKPRADPTEFNRSSKRDAAKHIDRSCSRRYRPSSRTPLVPGRSDPAGSSSVARLLNSGPDCADRLRGRSP